jgi:outer membrane protein assembly factor BamB
MRLAKRLCAVLMLGLAAALGLLACGSAPQRDPAPLLPVPEALGLGQAWQNSAGGRIEFPMQVGLAGSSLAVATSRGTVAVINTTTGADMWRARVEADFSSGVGFDGRTAVVTTIDNELIAFTLSSKNQPVIAWRKTLQARVYTAPLVAGGRVFVLAGDRTLQALDADTGAKLWSFQRSSEPLILSEAGTLGVHKNTLLVGHSGRLLGINPDNGQIQWELSVATSRATNDIERLIDLVGTPNRVGDSVCVRSFQTSIACADVAKGGVLWSRATQGATGVSGDTGMVVSTESDGRVKAWSRGTGDLLWSSDKLIYRGLSAPLLVGNSVIVGDADGYVHVMNKASGDFTARFKTDGGAIVAAPIVVGNMVVVATAKGGIYAYSPK